jgi:8-oxo-dGTP diphosphatase
MVEDNQDYAHIDVNPVIITSGNKIVLAKRKADVFEGGKWHLPGGRLLVGERIVDALKRLAKKKTGLDISLLTGSLLNDLSGVYDDPARDGREHVIALAYLCKVMGGEVSAGYNVSKVQAFGSDEINYLDIAFDHKQLTTDAFDKLKRLDTG